jgi:hypothetical protein
MLSASEQARIRQCSQSNCVTKRCSIKTRQRALAATTNLVLRTRANRLSWRLRFQRRARANFHMHFHPVCPWLLKGKRNAHMPVLTQRGPYMHFLRAGRYLPSKHANDS